MKILLVVLALASCVPVMPLAQFNRALRDCDLYCDQRHMLIGRVDPYTGVCTCEPWPDQRR